MKLESLFIKNFRSIETIRLMKCDGFNVLIGKNNSGKSNILSAIYAFFGCIQDGNFIVLDPKIGQEGDFFKQKNLGDLKNSSQIEITQIFLLSLDEIEKLKRNIVKETPQMKTAVDNINSSRLSVTIKVDHSDSPFCFVSKLALVDEATVESKVESEKNLLTISDKVALELRDNSTEKNNFTKRLKVIKELARNVERDSSRLSEKEREIRFRDFREELDYYLRNLEVPSNFFDEATRELLKSKNLSDLKEKIENTASKLAKELEFLQGSKLTNKIITFAGEESEIPKYIEKLLLEISKIKVHNLTERRNPIGKEEASRLLDLKVSRGGSKILREIQATVSSLLGVNIDAFKGSTSSAELDVDDFLVQLNGSGIREALRIILDVEFQKPDILLVEEPEVHLHPSLEVNLMQYLKKKSTNCQIFITTHSTNFLDTAEMKNIYLVSKSDSTIVESLNLEEAQIKIPEELGIRLSSLFMYDKLIFIEGPSDENILREMASKLGINLSKYNIGFIRMGGSRNFAYYATKETLSFLTKHRVEMWFLLDKDEKDQEYFEKLKQRLGGKANFKALNKRELENYLINPRALREFIKLKQDLSSKPGDLPKESTIKEDINICVDHLKQFTINKRLFLYLFSPLYPSIDIDFEHSGEFDIKEKISIDIQRMIDLLKTEKNNVDKIYDEQKESVNGNWDNIKLAIVPGDILIDNVCQKYGVRFNKAKDGERLARLLAKDEIDKEIKEVLQDIIGS